MPLMSSLSLDGFSMQFNVSMTLYQSIFVLGNAARDNRKRKDKKSACGVSCDDQKLPEVARGSGVEEG